MTALDLPVRQRPRLELVISASTVAVLIAADAVAANFNIHVRLPDSPWDCRFGGSIGALNVVIGGAFIRWNARLASVAFGNALVVLAIWLRIDQQSALIPWPLLAMVLAIPTIRLALQQRRYDRLAEIHACIEREIIPGSAPDQ